MADLPKSSSPETEKAMESSRLGTSVSVGHSTTMHDIKNRQADQELEDLGYVPELTRTKSLAHVVLMTFVLSAMPYGFSSSLYFSLVNGGPTTVVWGLLAVCLIILCLAASLAEITSVYPTAGGVYYQTFMLSPVRWRRLAAWICGWSVVAGTVIITLSVGVGTIQFLIACVNIFESEPGVGIWQPETYQVFLIYLAFTLLCNAIAALGNAKLHILDLIAVIATFSGVLAMSLCSLGIAKGGRRSAKYVFTHFEPLSGWSPGWAFCVGLLNAGYMTSATGMITSMCEEASDPSRQVPKAIVGVVGLNTIAALFFAISLMFVLPDLEMLVSLPSGQPLPTILKTAVGNDVGAFILCLPLITLCFICMVGCTTSASRYVWAFARDGGIPGSKWWKLVDKRLSVPLNALLLSMVVQILLGLIYFGSTAAFNAFTGAGVIFLTVAYAAPVAASFVGGRKDIRKGRFYLGRLGAFCNAIAIAWTIFAIPVFSMPAYILVTEASMNYASPVFMGFVLMSALWYWIWGAKNYQGPPTQPSAVDQVQHI